MTTQLCDVFCPTKNKDVKPELLLEVGPLNKWTKRAGVSDNVLWSNGFPGFWPKPFNSSWRTAGLWIGPSHTRWRLALFIYQQSRFLHVASQGLPISRTASWSTARMCRHLRNALAHGRSSATTHHDALGMSCLTYENASAGQMSQLEGMFPQQKWTALSDGCALVRIHQQLRTKAQVPQSRLRSAAGSLPIPLWKNGI